MTRKEEGKKYQVFYACGNQVTAVMCNSVGFPAQNEYFLSVSGIEFPEEEIGVETKYIPKHLILEIKVFKQPTRENPSCKVVNLNAKVS
jgi:hypothetical protein